MQVRKRIFSRWYVLVIFLLALSWQIVGGCGKEQTESRSRTARSQTLSTETTKTATTPASITGITLDPNLQSKTGTPAPDEMKALIALQAKVPYPVIVPTDLPSGLKLDKELIGSGKSASDPVGYYSYRYSHPDNASRTLTFNQSRANSRPLSGYYLTEVTINDTDYLVYWHKTLEYLPNGDPVRTTQVGDAETFIVVWKGQYQDANGQTQELFYSMTTGTWSGWGWGDIRNILESLKPLSAVGS